MAIPNRSFRRHGQHEAWRDGVTLWLIVSQVMVLAASPFLFASIPSLLVVGRADAGLYDLEIVLGWMILPLGTAACFTQAWQRFRRAKYEAAVLLTSLPVMLASLWLLTVFTIK